MTYRPHRATSVVAEEKERVKGAITIETPKANWETPHAVVMSGRYLRREFTVVESPFGVSLTEARGSSAGDSTTQGKIIEPASEIKENKKNAAPPFRARAPTGSVAPLSCAAVFASWR